MLRNDREANGQTPKPKDQRMLNNQAPTSRTANALDWILGFEHSLVIRAYSLVIPLAIASTTRSTLISFMHRKSIGHSRKKQGVHGTLAFKK